MRPHEFGRRLVYPSDRIAAPAHSCLRARESTELRPPSCWTSRMPLTSSASRATEGFAPTPADNQDDAAQPQPTRAVRALGLAARARVADLARGLCADETATSTVEYALLLALIVLSSLAAFQALGRLAAEQTAGVARGIGSAAESGVLRPEQIWASSPATASDLR